MDGELNFLQHPYSEDPILHVLYIPGRMTQACHWGESTTHANPRGLVAISLVNVSIVATAYHGNRWLLWCVLTLMTCVVYVWLELFETQSV